MSQADREVWLNFLDEVDEYLNTIESGLIGLAERGINPQQMDAALRAVHTIKGIGSMIECPSMSHLAHKFEDSLKIIRARRDAIQVDAALEMLLLQGLDHMRQVSSLHRQALPITEDWLMEQAQPTFEKLRDCLGDVQPSDELALLAEDSDDDTAVIMFGTEVEELLERLTSVLATPGLPCLQSELEMMVEELQDLGRMLQIDAFTALCHSIQQQLVMASPSQVEPIARQALALWERSQALVMVGKLDKLPTMMELTDDDLVPEPHPAYDALDEQTDDEQTDDEQTDDEQADIIIEPLQSDGLTNGPPTDTEVPDFTPLLSPEDSDTEIAEFEAFLTAANSDLDNAAIEALVFDTSIDHGVDTVIDLTLTNGLEETETAETTPAGANEPLEIPFSVTEDAIADDANPIGDVDLTGIEAAIEDLDPEDFDPTNFQVDDAFSPDLSDPALLDSETGLEDISASSEAEFDDISFEPQAEYASFFQTEADPEEIVEIHVEPVEPAPKAQELPENTVRVPIKLLNQINDLFGELIIQRNTMNSRLDQMDDLIKLLTKRMGSLEGNNAQLQTFCNQLSVDASVPGANHGPYKTTPNEQLLQTHQTGLESALLGPFAEPAFDSLELDRYSDLHLLSQDQRETLVQLREVTSDVKLNMREIKQASSNLNRTAKALQTNVTRARMRPLSDIVERFPRTVRELSLQYGKTVNLKISGGSTLIDRFVAVQLRDPLMHLLRNAFDHGIEDAEIRQAQGKPSQGTIEIQASHRGNQTLISISDDGSGIDLNKIRDRAYQMGLTKELLDTMSQSELLGMIFEPGFSTAAQVTNLSGRGIGMDVVRNNLELIRSEIKVDTQAGLGTTFTIGVPFTLSIVRVLLVEIGGMRLAFPTDGVEEMIRFNTVQVFDSPDQQVINWEGLTVPLIHLEKWLTFRGPLRSPTPDASPIISEPSIIIVSQGERLSGLHIDRFWGEREVVIRQVENVISLPPGFTGCTILEDGHVVPLADASKLLEWIEQDSQDEDHQPRRWQQLLQSSVAPEPPQQLALPQAQQNNILVVDDSINMRQLLRTTLEQAGYGVEQGKDGQDAVDQLLGGLSVDAIVCDIEMPRLDGYGVLAEIKADAQLKNLPIIMLTSRGSEKHRQLAMRLGATAYITKPYQDHELLLMIEQVLQQQPVSTVQ
ncbi:response regulator [Leptolyngbya cf. ectocarpi LEGE 11479]|uniref:histidine kinase n=1 Tax=Leptolyngbya cf. ectocarpi LEGE 11479 TaxID=1828722 RepID=A0A928ZYT0_LEPEC|nr:response regulator [Leptolyngbya ectocarpi]MBE9069925.1 response regulator [Leptolyngbya cf. ectocarpi LEGE 11479]